MKKDIRFIGFDDSPFAFNDEQVRIVAVVTRGASYVEGVLSQHIAADGDDATDRLADMVLQSRFRSMLRAILLNGATMGGFNVVDLAELNRRTGIPVISVVRAEPRYEKTESALQKHFPDAERRIRLLASQRPVAVSNGTFSVWCSYRGLGLAEVAPLLRAATVRGAIPEPIRLAHVIASGIARGHSRGPA